MAGRACLGAASRCETSSSRAGALDRFTSDGAARARDPSVNPRETEEHYDLARRHTGGRTMRMGASLGLALLGLWLGASHAAADLDGSGCVDLGDLATLLAHYGE